MNSLIPEMMKAARRKKGLRQDDVAELLHVKGNTISNWETGATEPDIDSFVQYCHICGANYIEILTQAYGDPTAKTETVECTAAELEMIRRFRALDERGKKNVRRTLNAEYEDAMASFGEDSQNVPSTG